MRKILPVVALGLVLGACGGSADEMPPVQPPAPPVASATPPTDTTPPPAATAETPAPKPALADLIQTSLKSYPANFGDAAKVAAMYAPDATLNVAGFPPIVGRDAIQQFHKSFIDAQTNPKLTMQRVWMKGNMTATEWVLSGSQSKDWNGIPATEKPYGIVGASLLTFNDDGLITKDDRYFDMGTYLGQIGIAKHTVRPIATPGGSLEVHVAKGTPDEDKLADMARSMDKTFETHDAKAFLAALTDDTLYDAMDAPTTFKGPKPAKAFFEGFTKAFPDAKVTVANAFGVEDYAIQEYTMDATQKAPLSMGPGMNIPNTKKTISTHTLEILQIKDGKLVHGWGYSNGMEMMGQLGLMKPSDKAADGKTVKPSDKVQAPKTDKAAQPSSSGKGAATDKGAAKPPVTSKPPSK